MMRPTSRLLSAGAHLGTPEYQAMKHHAKQTHGRWRMISLLVVTPAVGVAGYNAWRLAKEHEEHLQHHPTEYIQYQYRTIRRKNFPWGNKSLFHNDEVNHVPE
jgi:cytochrome c oxidase subunit 6a